ncbi:MAG TPA: DUF3037 domain-containing protein [Steroidobacteraceae bacterium]|jgi:hypothetical protein|nr:DUF3037 domain-containing protein [Steroidobacteraceae bacterium]
MHALHTYDYAVVRVVPRVERGEFLNAGIILSCDAERVLAAGIELDENALLAIDQGVDLDLVRRVLASIPAICAGGEAAGDIGKMSARERFHWLVAPRSTIVQTSPVHTGQCAEPAGVLEHLMQTMVRRRQGRSRS